MNKYLNLKNFRCVFVHLKKLNIQIFYVLKAFEIMTKSLHYYQKNNIWDEK